MKTNKTEEEIDKVCDEMNGFIKKTDNFLDEFVKVMNNNSVKEIEVYKFITEQELKNIDVILNILKLVTSLSISIFIASLTTNYFNGKIDIIITINIISIILLITFILVRNNILLKNKTILLEAFKKSATVTLNTLLSKHDKIRSEYNYINKKHKIIKDFKK